MTGGCGFLGSNLAADALAKGDKVMVFENLSRDGAVQNKKWLENIGNIEFVHGDIRNQMDISRCIAAFKPDAIFHLAGQVAMTTSIHNSRMDFETNTLGSFNLLEAVKTHVPNATVIYSSTNKVYGDLEQYTYVEAKTRYNCKEFPEGFSEDTPLDFRTPYGCSKGSADQYMLDFAKSFDINTIVFRHSSMYGGRQFATYDQGWVGWFCKQAVLAQEDSDNVFTISGNGKQVRDVLHVTDILRLYRLGVENISKAKGHAFNIGGGIENSLSLLELFSHLEELLAIELKYTQLPPRMSDQRVFVADIYKAQELLKWKPSIDKVEGLKNTIDWIKNGNH